MVHIYISISRRLFAPQIRRKPQATREVGAKSGPNFQTYFFKLIGIGPMLSHWDAEEEV